MQVIELKNESLCYDIKVTIFSNEVEKKIEQELIKLSKTININGFRPGKAPISFVKKRYYNSVRSDVVNELISDFYKNLIEEKKLNILNEPKLEEFENKQNYNLEFVLKFELLPNIEMPDFKSINIIKPITEVNEEDISEFLMILSKEVENFKKIDEESKIGYRVNIDFVGYVDGKEFEGGRLVNCPLLLGSGDFIPGFEEQLVGKKAGEEVDVNVTFPEKYHELELASKDAKFVVKINFVEEPIDVIIDDKFAKKFKLANLDEMKKDIKKSLIEQREDLTLSFMRVKLFNYLNNNIELEIPRSLLDKEYNSLKQNIKKEDDEEGLLEGKTDKEIDDYFQYLAKRRVKIGLILSEYAKNNHIEVTDDEIRDEMYRSIYHFSGDKNMLMNLYKKHPDLARNNFHGPLIEQKSVKHIIANQINYVEQIMTYEELKKISEEEEKLAISTSFMS